MIIAIDFDGTIVEHKYPDIGKLRIGARKIINKLYDEGNYIIIWTCRYDGMDLDKMIWFLRDKRICYNNINSNKPGIGFNPYPKIYADIYIDDHNLGGVPSWYEIYKKIKGD